MSIQIKLGNQGKTIKVGEDIIVTVLREVENKLLSRVEVELFVDHITRGTPSRKEMQKIVSSLYNVPEDHVIIKKIISEYGRGSSRVHVNIYWDKNVMKRVEPKYIFKRLGLEI
jgi:small subunit ribosomal protein S24e